MKSQELAMQLSPEEFRELSGASNESLERLIVYVDLLKKWQKSINLVGKNSLLDIWRRHILDSAQLSKHIDSKTVTIADIGTFQGWC
jgi:16S rRNA (guanine527-N7)-methyltransferase